MVHNSSLFSVPKSYSPTILNPPVEWLTWWKAKTRGLLLLQMLSLHTRVFKFFSLPEDQAKDRLASVC